ncbi:class I SAM-dependent methyltransferase [Candidatus Kaiserbacteria bacterium]|nr:class I SAM-dependent methyltransferase [Candidatus Kaiserbacteria bacterium]
MWDPVWESVFRNQVWGQYPGEEQIRFIARNFYRVPDRSSIRILEVGCGPGANIWYLAREGFSFVGIDGSETAIAQTRERLDREFPDWQKRGELRVGDIESLPYSDATFDAVMDVEAVYCNDFATSIRIYDEMARVVKPGGANCFPGLLLQTPGAPAQVNRLV